MELKCTLETRTSKKDSTYKCLVIEFPGGYEKVVFLDKAELALLKNIENIETTEKMPFEFK